MSDVTPGGAEGVPTWYACGLLAGLVFVAGTQAVSLLMLVYGRYHPIAAVVSGAVVAASTVLLLGRLLRRPPDGRVSRVAAIAAAAAVVLAGGVTLWNESARAEHVLADRDPGVYTLTARGLVRFHTLTPDVGRPAFGDGVHYGSVGHGDGDRDGRVRPNFLQGLPTLLAAGTVVSGDDGLFAVPPLLSGLAIAAFYAASTRVLRVPFALAATVAFALVPAHAWFARDAYSELPVLVGVLGGWWLYLEARVRAEWLLAALGGMFLGLGALARVDALAVLVGVAGVLAVESWAAAAAPDPGRRRTVAAALAGSAAASSAFGYWLDWQVNYSYVRALGSEVVPLATVAIGALLGAAGWSWLVATGRVPVPSARALKYFGAAVVAVLVAAALFAWFLRPLPAGERPDLTALGGRPLVGELRRAVVRWHSSRSLRWLGWYVGPVAVLAAVAGYSVGLTRAVRRVPHAAAVVAALALPATVLYLWRPSISVDHFWAMRRYLPVVLPAAVLMAFIAGEAVVAAVARSLGRRALGVAATVAVCAVLVVPAAVGAAQLGRAQEQRGGLDAMRELCQALGPDAAAVVVTGSTVELVLPHAARVFCGIPVARAVEDADPEWFRERAAAWSDAGRRLVVVGANRAAVAEMARGAPPVLVVFPDADRMERTPDRRPRVRTPRPQHVWIAPVEAPGNGEEPS